MRIYQVQSNNYSCNTNKNAKTLNFKKLIIDKSVDKDILKEIIKNDEILKLVSLFHGIGIDLRAIYKRVGCDVARGRRGWTSLQFVNNEQYKKYLKNSERNFDRLYSVSRTGVYNSEPLDSSDFARIQKGDAEKAFQNYFERQEFLHEIPRRIKEQMQLWELEILERDNYLKKVDDFNKSLERSSRKNQVEKPKSFWEKISNLFS